MNVVQAQDWDILSYNEDVTSPEVIASGADAVMQVNTMGYEPQTDEYIVFHLGNQPSQAMRVVNVEKTENGCQLALKNILDLSEVLTSISVATSECQLQSDDLGVIAATGDGYTNVALTEWWWTSGINCEATVTLEKGEEPEVAMSICGVAVDMEDDPEEEEEDNEGLSGDASATISVSLENIRVNNAFTYEIGKGMDFFDFYVSSDVNVSLEGELSYGGDIALAPIPLSMGGPDFLYEVQLVPYIHIEADGTISITYSITRIKAGVSYSNFSGELWPYITNGTKELTGELQCSLGAGLGVRCQINVLGYDIADPSVEFKAVAEAKTLDAVSGYEKYPCVSITVAAPVVTIKASDENGDSLLYKFIEKFGFENEFDVIAADNPLQNSFQVPLAFGET